MCFVLFCIVCTLFTCYFFCIFIYFYRCNYRIFIREKINNTYIQTLSEKCLFSEFFWSVFPHIRTEFSEFPIFSSNAGKYGPEKLRIRILLTKWKTSKQRNDSDVYSETSQTSKIELFVETINPLMPGGNKKFTDT